MSDVHDVETYFEEESNQKKQYIELLETVQRRARDAANSILDKAKKANELVLDKLEKNIQLSSSEKRDILDHEQNILRKKLMSELVQTKASMIIVKNQIEKLTNGNEGLIPKSALESGYKQVVTKGRIQANNSMILKLQLQQQYLEGIFAELSSALQAIREMILINRVTPVVQDIDDLLSEVDRIQAESYQLAGRAEELESEAEALKDFEEEL